MYTRYNLLDKKKENNYLKMKTLPNNPKKLDKPSTSAQLAYKMISKFPFMPSSGTYNLTISHEQKFVWFRVAKVGTRTIFNHLKESGIILDAEHPSWLKYPLKPYENYFKFAFVRNPWDRLASCWRDKVLKKNYFKFDANEYEKMKFFDNFIDFVSSFNIEKCDRHFRSQSALIDLNAIDYLGRLESFDKDADYIFSSLGLRKKEVSKKNVTSNDSFYRQYYNKDTAEKVSKIYQKDIQIFGYKF